MPFGYALITFIVIELWYGSAINNLEASFGPALMAGTAVFIVSGWQSHKHAQELDNPAAQIYRLRFPLAYAEIKEILKICCDAPDNWRISHDRSDKGRIFCWMQIKDDSFREQRWLVPTGIITKSINLEVTARATEDGSTELTLRYTVDAPFPATRIDCNHIIAHTTGELYEALEHLEVMKHGRTAS